jgi:hypothetical protein
MCKRIHFEAAEAAADAGPREAKMIKAVLTDVQFWIPVGVLAAGILLLVMLH